MLPADDEAMIDHYPDRLRTVGAERGLKPPKAHGKG